MYKKIKIISIVLILTIFFNILISIIYENKTYAVTQSVSTDINAINDSKYPGIKDRINALKNKYPNWNFKILYTGLDWNEVITNEYKGHGASPKNLVYKTSNYQGEWICAICGDKQYDNGNWRCASEKAIAYMMDPRNSINASDVFQFEELTNIGCDINILKKMTNGTFLSGHEQSIIDTSNKNNVNAYYVVARLIQEQGKAGTILTSGSGYNGQNVGYYNAFNIAASGNSTSEILSNALAYAKKKGWTSLDKSIDGGISFIANQYIKKGQNTLYLQKFDVESTNGLYSNQYMQNVLAAQNEGTTLKNTYISTNSIATSHTFIIPVYENMPTSVCSRPSTTVTSTTNLDTVKVNVNSSIRLRDSANGSTTVGWLYKDEIVTRIEKATSKVGGTYWDKVQKSNGTIGYVARETYENESEYKLYLVPLTENNSTNNQSSNSNSTNTNINNSTSNSTKKGDVNGDGKITSSDYVLIKNHIMGTSILNSEQQNYADYNEDGKITSSDYVLIKNYIMNN